MFQLKDSLIQGNGGSGVRVAEKAKGQLTACRLVRNRGGVLDVETDNVGDVVCSGNVAIVSSPQSAIPGFRIENDNEERQSSS